MQEERSREYNEKRRREWRFQTAVYVVMFAYIFSVCLNAVGVSVLFFLNVAGVTSVGFQYLATWAIGSGGLGAGSLIFRIPMRRLFSRSAN
jgi:hypothetical protein